MIDDILGAIKASLQAETRLSSVTKYHLVDGMVPGVKATVSIGCGRIRYSDYDSEKDEAIAPVRIYVYIQEMNAERGESTIRSLAKEIRFTLLENMYLGGLVDESTVTEIVYESDQVQNGQLIHYAMIDYEVKYYEPRHRSDDDQYLAERISADFNEESIEIEL